MYDQVDNYWLQYNTRITDSDYILYPEAVAQLIRIERKSSILPYIGRSVCYSSKKLQLASTCEEL